MIDVVICFFRSHLLWPRTAYGLACNQDYINSVIISNDEAWDDNEKQAMDIVAKDVGLKSPLVFVGHERNGMRQAQCINDGVAAATMEDILQIDDDIALAPGCLKTFWDYSANHMMFTGNLPDVGRDDLTLEQLKLGPTILREDRRNFRNLNLLEDIFAVRDSFLFYNKEDYLKVGGHDTAYHDGQDHGYGFVDWDFAIRWFKEFGHESYDQVPATAYHMSGTKPGHMYSEINKKLFEGKVAEYAAWLEAKPARA